MKIIEFFSNKHIFTNFLVIAVFIGAIIFWHKTNKEEFPNMTMDFVAINATYPGATPEEIEHFVTKEIEDALTGIDGIEEISSTSSQGVCNVRIFLTRNHPNRKNVVEDINDAIDTIKFPDDVDDPYIWEFKSSKIPIIDLMLITKDTNLMNDVQRKRIQSYVDTLEDRLLRLPSVSEVGISGYLDNYIEIQIIPEKLAYYNISISQIISAIKKNNLKQPLGTLDDQLSSKIKLNAEISEIENIKNIVVQSSFEGKYLRLKDLANVEEAFEKPESFFKVNGSEAIRLNVTKSTNFGIIESIDQVKKITEVFSNTVLKNTNVKLKLMTDKSDGVKNRLQLIALNGLFGFILILIILFIFLNQKSAIWVAMGIPFTFGFTMILASLLGHTINNITLAAVIIVMGMVVDDAIVVAENVTRLLSEGMKPKEAVITGTTTVLLPIVASITTTCVAFIPLLFFQGRFSMMTRFIPPIIFLMLGGSLFEAIFILPSHLKYNFPRWVRIIFSLGLLLVIEKKFIDKTPKEKQAMDRVHWFMRVEDAYGNLLKKILRIKWVFYVIFILLLIYSGFIFFGKMKFVMFPREETTQVMVTGTAPHGALKEKTEEMIRPVEDIFKQYIGKEVIGFTTGVAQTRWGGRSRENSVIMEIELVSKDKRKKSLNTLMSEWEEELNKISGFESLQVVRSRFGQSSGSPIDIIIKENIDDTRFKIAEDVKNYLMRFPAIKSSEIESQFNDPEYSLELKRDLIDRLNISADTIATSLRTILEGANVYDISKAGKDIEVIVTVPPDMKKNINSILNIPIENKLNYLIPLNKIVNINKKKTPTTITRLEGKRIIHVYADMISIGQTKEPPKSPQNNNKWEKNNNWNNKENKEKENIEKFDLSKKMTILEIADYLEENLIPEILEKHPTSEIVFSGEIKDTRESSKDFLYAILLIILLIYVILALTLNSLYKPLIIMISIPFGFIGIVLALQFHGMMIYGFFSIIGALGLAGVVVNDSIVLLAKLESEYSKRKNLLPYEIVADITKTRLRAVLLTTITTVTGLLPTAYGIFGYDSMLAEMMLTMAWGLIFGTLITLVMVPSMYCSMKEIGLWIRKRN